MYLAGCVATATLRPGVNPFSPTDRFSSIQNNERKSPIKLLSVQRVNL